MKKSPEQIIISIYTHQSKIRNEIILDPEDILIEKLIHTNFKKSEFLDLEIAVEDVDVSNLVPERWYHCTFKKTYEDDGSNENKELFFDFVSVTIVPEETGFTIDIPHNAGYCSCDQCKIR